MRLIRKGDVELKQVTADKEGNPAEGTCIQVLTPDAPNFVMRLFTLSPGGSTPLHTHPWEHEIYIVSGSGVTGGEVEEVFSAGDAIYVPAGDRHCFRNTGEADLRMICVVPQGTG